MGIASMNARILLWLALVAVALVTAGGLRAEEKKTGETTERENNPAPKDPAELFADLDQNGDGKLTADEISAAQKRFFERLLRVAGEQTDGEFTSAEFLKGFKADDLKVAAPPNLGGPGGPGGQFDPNQM